MSQKLVCRVPSCRKKGFRVRANQGPVCGRHALMSRELSFEEFRKKHIQKRKTAKAAAARVKAMVPPPERLLGSFIASTTKAGPVTGVVSTRGTGKQAHLLVASFEGGIVRTLKGSTIESGNVIYQKLTEGATFLGHVAAPGHEDKRKVFAKYLALPTFSQIGEPRVTAVSETSTKALVVYSERLPESRFFCKLANCVAAREQRLENEEEPKDSSRSAKGASSTTKKSGGSRRNPRTLRLPAAAGATAPARRRTVMTKRAGRAGDHTAQPERGGRPNAKQSDAVGGVCTEWWLG